MKKYSYYIGALLLSVFIAINVSAREKGECSGAAIVDVQKIINESLSAKTIKEQLDKKNNEYQSQINKKEEELNKRSQELSKQQEDLNKKIQDLTKPQAAAEKESLDNKVRDFNNQVVEVQREAQVKKSALEQASMVALGEIQKALDDIIEKLADERNFCMAIPSSQTLYYKKNLDISDVVLKSLNDRLKKVDVKIPTVNNNPKK